MPTRDTAPLGAPCWVDLSTSDTQRTRDFYSRLLGWTAEAPAEEFGGYFQFTRGGAPVAGCMPSQPGADSTDGWAVYLASDDAQKTVESVTENGGQVIAPPMAVGDLGVMALVTDPHGAAVGIWQPVQFQGLGVLGEPGSPSWFELHTRNYEQAVTFYREVFRWDVHVVGDTPEFRYTTLRRGEDWLAGIMDASAMLPEGSPDAWSVYFGVDDTDAALARVVELGGSVVMPAEDTPYGRLAAATDPNGAGFKLVGTNAAMPARDATP